MRETDWGWLGFDMNKDTHENGARFKTVILVKIISSRGISLWESQKVGKKKFR